MAKKEFGVNLSQEEKQFMEEYIKSIREGQPRTDFDEYEKFNSIVGKLTQEELAEISEIRNSVAMKEFEEILEQDENVSMQDIVKNAINKGVTAEQVEKIDRMENLKANEKNIEGVEKGE